MTKRLSPEEKRARAEARKAAQTQARQGQTKESTMDSSNDQTDPAGAAEPEIATNQASPEGELKVENLNDQTPPVEGNEQEPVQTTGPVVREAKPPFLPTEGSPPAAPEGQKPGLARLLAAAAQLRGEHRRNHGTGYPRLFIDNVCRALDQYEQENQIPPPEQPGQPQSQLIAPAVEQPDGAEQE